MKEKIVIIWWGTTGWITALFLSKKLPSYFDITLVSSTQIWTLWVWESTIPHIVSFLAGLWIDENEMMKYCDATYKMGVKFTGWSGNQESFLNPFSRWLTSKSYHDFPFSHYWFHGFSDLDYAKISDLSYFTFQQKLSPKSHDWEFLLDYAYHLDSYLLGEFLKEKAVSNGVHHIEWKMEDFSVDINNNIEHVIVDGRKIQADIFLDCSGFHSLLISQMPGNNFCSYADELLVDKALFCKTEREDNSIAPYTQATAMNSGWRWKIPLCHQNGNGYVYSSQHISDEDAMQEFRTSLWISEKHKVWELHMKLWRYDFSWIGNCIWIWPSYGFIEPLEATWIYLTCRQLELFVTTLKQVDYKSNNVVTYTYNDILAAEYDAVKDFIALHYAASKKSDSAFWVDSKKSIWTSLNSLLNILSQELPDISFDQHLPSLFKYQSYTIILIGLWYYDDLLLKKNISDHQIWYVKKDVYDFLSKNKLLLKKLKTHRQVIDDIHS